MLAYPWKGIIPRVNGRAREEAVFILEKMLRRITTNAHSKLHGSSNKERSLSDLDNDIARENVLSLRGLRNVIITFKNVSASLLYLESRLFNNSLLAASKII